MTGVGELNVLRSAHMPSQVPSFWILDAVTPDGRDGLYGMVTTTRAAWWTTEFGRHYSGRKGTWRQETFTGSAPVSLAYQHANGAKPAAWHVLTADGQVISSGNKVRRLVGVAAPMRRLRWWKGRLIAVGSRGQVFVERADGDFEAVQAFLEAGAFLVDVASRGDDVLMVGRNGQAVMPHKEAWAYQQLCAGDLHVVTWRGEHPGVGGDEGFVSFRAAKGKWATVATPVKEPIVGLVEHEGEVWASTPTGVLRGTRRSLKAVDGPGFGGQLTVGDGRLYCFGVAHIAHFDGKSWQQLENPDQHFVGPPPEWPSLGPSLDASVKRVTAASLGGRLFGEDDLTPADVRRWAALSSNPKQASKFLGSPGMYKVLEVDGDLRVKGDLSTFDLKLTGLVVHGNLTVDGVFNDNDDPRSFTVVGGSMKARTIITSGELEVRGAMKCEHLVGDYNDYGAHFHGPVDAKLFYPEHHAFTFDAAPKFKVCVGARALGRGPAALRKALRSDLLRGELDEETEVDRKAVLAALRKGESIWRTPASRKK